MIALERPRTTIALAALAVVLSGIALARVDLVTDVSEMIEAPAALTMLDAGRTFGLNEAAFVLVEANEDGREDDLRRFAAGLALRLEEDPAIASVRVGSAVDEEALFDRLVLRFGPLYFEPSALEAWLRPTELDARAKKQASRLAMMGLGDVDRWVERDPFELHRPAIERLSSLGGAPGQGSLSSDGRKLLVTVIGHQGASSQAQARDMVRATNAGCAALLSEPGGEGLAVHLAGGPFLAEESERIIRGDLTLSLSVSLVLAVLLLAIGLRTRLHVVLLLLIPTVWGSIVGAGLFALARPRVAVLSFAFAAVLIGLGIDFTIHVCAAARTARASGASARQAVERALISTSGALVLAALTSASAFLAFQTAHQHFLRDMGLLIACGLLACLVGALVVLPVILLRMKEATAGPRTLGVLSAINLAQGHPRVVIGVTGLLSIAAGVAVVSSPPGFETDLRRIHATDSRPLAAQDRITEAFGGSQDAVILLLDASDEAAAVAACHRLEPHLRALIEDGTLASRASVAGLLPPVAEQRASLEVLGRHPAAEVEGHMRSALEAAGFDPASFDGYLARMQIALARETPVTPDEIRAAGLAPLVDGFVRPNPKGGARALVAVYPREALWTGDARAHLVGRLRAALASAGVEGRLGGLPLLSAEVTHAVELDFRRVSLMTLLAVAVVLTIRFRRPDHVLLALLPAALGALWTAAVFALFGWRLNLMNLGVLPMVLAIGVDDGIHILHRFLRGGTLTGSAFASTALGVLLTSLTTMVTFGSLATSSNQGIASVGLLTLVGVGGCLVASVLVLPAILGLIETRGRARVE